MNFKDLQSISGLKKLDRAFLVYLSEQDFKLYANYIQARANNEISGSNNFDTLLEVSHYVDDFIAELFSIESENEDQKLQCKEFSIVYECRRKFVQRQAIKKYSEESLQNFSFDKTTSILKGLIGDINQKNIAAHYFKWSFDSQRYEKELDLMAKYCAFMVYRNSSLLLFDLPQARQDSLISKRKISRIKETAYLGFDYRDNPISLHESLPQAKYCLYCHKRSKDTCRTGFDYKKEAVDLEKNGCPLKQRISEMALLHSQGFLIASLAVIVIDNPMVAATGHRICNDCMKTCIYQKQDPVNIPIIESGILEQVLSLPWGVEIYLLLTQWNPLNLEQILPMPGTNYNILIAGLGPAGFALSHYLLRLGHNVMAIDGLKIMPLSFDIGKPIKFWSEIKQPLSKRVPQGFGGVAEYGITSRWNKNNLTLIRLILERNNNFTLQGSLRLGSNITVKQAFEMNFHHIALCLGAGKPKYIASDDFFLRGVKAASDFLMTLQQGGAFLKENNIKLMVRMPAVVIGCGLTAIDSAVELMHYYPIQVEKFLSAWEKRSDFLANLDPLAQELAKDFINHGKLLRGAKNDQEKLAILQDVIGGVTICYRKTLKESPAYRSNHEEIEHAIASGIKFEEEFRAIKIVADKFHYVEKIISDNQRELEAKTVLLAIGTQQNEFIDLLKNNTIQNEIFKTQDKNISYFGDCNQKYAGSVVKALASAKNGYKKIDAVLRELKPLPLSLKISELQSKIVSLKALSSKLLEITIESPYLAKNFRPGQFFKLQNYADIPSKILKPIALTGIKVDKLKKKITLCAFNNWNFKHCFNNLKIGNEIALMGPVGMSIPLIKGKKITLIADDFNNILIISIGNFLRKNNCDVTLIAFYSHVENVYYQNDLEKFANRIIWVIPQNAQLKKRQGDIIVNSGLIDSIMLVKKGYRIHDTDQIICYTNPRMRDLIIRQKKVIFGSKTPVIYSLYSSMYCMMKGICGQCITQDPSSGGYVFACQKQYL
ncbi:MAG TPA: FAD-dependent oxidoreductase [Candidatus Megaira endosymbiont of Nemacystus decipiens]|nr:FAD-dependent oxidoreductase [Candidatus Megaera endosymbiont of Nemacystus decipiens]